MTREANLDVDGTSAGSGSMIFLGGPGEQTPSPPRALYAVFRRAPRSSDLEVQKRAREDALLDPTEDRGGPGLSLGSPLYSETRLVVGTLRNGVYALPTTTGAVCMSALSNGGGSCGEPFRHGLTVGFDYGAAGRPVRLYGLVGDDVRSVDIVVDGVPVAAELGENGYSIELSRTGRGDLSSLVLHVRSGATERVPLQP